MEINYPRARRGERGGDIAGQGETTWSSPVVMCGNRDCREIATVSTFELELRGPMARPPSNFLFTVHLHTTASLADITVTFGKYYFSLHLAISFSSCICPWPQDLTYF